MLHDNAELTRTGQLLHSILHPAELWDTKDLAEMLSHQLTVPLPFLFAPRPGEGSLPNATLGDALFGDHPSPRVLERLKEFAKASRWDPDAPLPPEIATVLYLACIAAAKVRCGTRISSIDDAGLAAGI